MKTGIHPEYHQITIACACGNSFEVGSTHNENIRVEVCSHCHPLYTGKTNLIDAAGRLDKFQARQKKAESMQAAASSRKGNKKEVAPTATPEAEAATETN